MPARGRGSRAGPCPVTGLWNGGARRAYLCPVAVPDTLPPAMRASDSDREHVIGVLRSGSAEGRLSYDTFLQRVDIALNARGLGELAGLVADLPVPGRPESWRDRAARGWRALCRRAARARAAWQPLCLPRLALPRGDRTFVIGRAPDCDLRLADITVSWRHAALRPGPDGWLLADLASTNGTRVNGWAAGAGFTVRPGDRVRFGTAEFLITD